MREAIDFNKSLLFYKGDIDESFPAYQGIQSKIIEALQKSA